MGHCRPYAHRARHGRFGFGYRQPQAAGWSDLPFRPRSAVHLRRFSIGTARRMVSDVPWAGQVFVTTMPYRNRPSRPTRTVSYTHLRAHETDSYLVCRLLLEKKKKK